MKIINIILFVLITNCLDVQAQQQHEWHVVLKAVDETDKPVPGANAGVGFYTNSMPTSIDGFTDTNGVFVASHQAENGLLSFTVEKTGYYKTWAQLDLGFEYNQTKWNPTVTMVLKKIGKPIAMSARLVDENPPALEQPIGYDLMIGDWVCVGHKGVNADIVFQKWVYRKSGADYEYRVKVTFPKKGDGIQIYTIPDSEKGSNFRSPHEAPLNGYQPELNKERSAHPGQPTKNDYDPNRIYLFRVRTAIDDRGNIVSAHYGKIYGDFMQFTYYLNPTPNDRNIEFDPKQNLIHNLKSFERVTAP
jgi:hypothetical protein